MLSTPIRWPKPVVRVPILGGRGHGRSTVALAACERSRRLGRRCEGGGAYILTTERVCHFLVNPRPHRAGQHLLGCEPPDVAILVVAADQGTTADLVTQVRLARIRGVNHFVICLTHADRVADLAWADLVEADARRMLADEGVPADEVPAVRGDFAAVVRDPGRDAGCVDALLAVLDAVPPPVSAEDGPFRMCVEDVFHIESRGTVVTGAVLRGSAKIGDVVEVIGLGMPPLSTAVTGLELFGHRTGYARPGDNAALILTGVRREDVTRGQIVAAPGTAVEVPMIEAVVAADVELDEPVRWQLHVHAATTMASLRGVRGLDGSPIPFGPLPDQPVRSWWHLETRLAVEPGDRMVLVDAGRSAGVGVVVPSLGE